MMTGVLLCIKYVVSSVNCSRKIFKYRVRLINQHNKKTREIEIFVSRMMVLKSIPPAITVGSGITIQTDKKPCLASKLNYGGACARNECRSGAYITSCPTTEIFLVFASSVFGWSQASLAAHHATRLAEIRFAAC